MRFNIRHRTVVAIIVGASAAMTTPLLSVHASGSPQTHTINRTTSIPVRGAECQALQASNEPCTALAKISLTMTVSTPLLALNSAAAYYIGGHACAPPIGDDGQDSCNIAYGNMRGGLSCGSNFTFNGQTEVDDVTGGHLWWSRVSYMGHGTVCSNAFFDSVDCGHSGGNGYSVDVTWCGDFNNGAGAPWTTPMAEMISTSRLPSREHLSPRATTSACRSTRT